MIEDIKSYTITELNIEELLSKVQELIWVVNRQQEQIEELEAKVDPARLI